MKQQEVSESIVYPSILFRLQNEHFAVGCKDVASIMQMPAYELLPDAPANVLGIFKFRDKVIPIVCLRGMFGMNTMDQETQSFNAMLDARKQDHVNWVKELSRCAREHDPFTLATDAHACALGRWYDNYKPDNQAIKMHLKKMETPHQLLHQAALELDRCSEDCDHCKREECLRDTLKRVTKTHMPQIISVLEDAKGLFEEQRRSLLIVIDTGDYAFAMSVDEVLAVEDLIDIAAEQQVSKLKGSVYIKEIKKSTKLDRLILMIDDEKLSRMAKDFALEEAMA